MDEVEEEGFYERFLKRQALLSNTLIWTLRSLKSRQKHGQLGCELGKERGKSAYFGTSNGLMALERGFKEPARSAVESASSPYRINKRTASSVAVS